MAGAAAILLLSIPHPTVEGSDSGLLVVALRIHDVLTSFALMGICLLVGAFILRSRRLDPHGGVNALAACMVVGAGAIGALLLIAGLVGQFQPTAVIAVTAGATVLSASSAVVSSLRSLVLMVGREIRSLFEGWSSIGLVGLSAALLVYTLFMALGPTTSWDGPMYHVDLAREFLDHGRIHLPVDNLHAAFVGSPQMLNAVVLAAGAESGPAVIQWVWTVALLGVVVTTSARWVSPRAGAWSAMLFWAYPIVPLIGSSDLVDMAMSTALFTFVVVLADRLRASESGDGLLLGFLGGAAALTKYQAIPYLLGAAVFWLVWSGLGRSRFDWSEALLAGAVCLTLFTPWIVKNVILFGAPLYPFFTEQTYPPLLEGLVHSSSLQPAESYSFLGSVRERFSLPGWIFRPETLTPESVGRWYGLPPLFLLGVTGFVGTHRRRLALMATPVALGALVLLAASPRTNLRYLMPVAPAAIVALAASAAHLWERIRPTLAFVTQLSIVLMSLVLISDWMLDVTVPTGRATAGIGIISEDEFAGRPANFPQRRIRALDQALDAFSLNDSTRALLFFEARGDLFDNPVWQDNLSNSWQMLSDGLVGQCLQSPAVGVVVLNTPTLDSYRARGASEFQLRESQFREFADRCLTYIGTVDGYEVYVPA